MKNTNANIIENLKMAALAEVEAVDATVTILKDGNYDIVVLYKNGCMGRSIVDAEENWAEGLGHDYPDEVWTIEAKGKKKRAVRRAATRKAKAKNREKAEFLGMNNPWKEATHSKWVDPYLKHAISEGDWHNWLRRPNPSKVRRQASTNTLLNWRAEYDRADVTLENSYQWRYWEREEDYLYALQMEEEDEERW